MPETLFVLGVLLIGLGLARYKFPLDEGLPALWPKLKSEIVDLRSPSGDVVDLNAMELFPNIILKYPPILVGGTVLTLLLGLFYADVELDFTSAVSLFLRTVFASLLMTALFGALLIFASHIFISIYTLIAGFVLDTVFLKSDNFFLRLPFALLLAPIAIAMGFFVWVLVLFPTLAIRGSMFVLSFQKFVPFALGIPMIVGALIFKFH